MKALVFSSILCAGLITARIAAADDAIVPPAGWEAPAAPVKSDKPAKEKKKAGPACCAFDSTCCSRQADIDSHANPQSVVRVIEVHLADLPEASIREVAEGAPPLEDVPPVRLINDQGQPFPWSDAPREIRMLPPGPLGEIGWNSEWGGGPSFDEDEFKGMGWGDVHFLKEKAPYNNEAEINGKVEYVSIKQGEGDKLIFDIAKGTVLGSPKLKATYHLHAEAMHIVDHVVHGYRATTKEKEETINWVNFLLPQVVDGFESRDAKHRGGFFPSRFSRQWSYSLYRLPYGPGKSNLATFRMDDDDNRRWLGVSKKRPPKTFIRNVLVSASQTSVESEARIRVMFFDDFSFQF